MTLISQLITAIIRVLKNLLKYSNGTITATFFVSSFPIEAFIFCLKLNKALFQEN